MRVATLLFEDVGVDQLRSMKLGLNFHGRLLMTRWISEGIIAHPDVSEFAVYGEGADVLPGARAVPMEGLTDWLLGGDAIWFEPARHYWWKPSLVRQATGQTFPIVTMLYSIGYPYQVAPLIASLAAPRRAEDRVIAPSALTAQVFLKQCESLVSVMHLQVSLPNVVVIPYGVPPVRQTPQQVARHALAWDERPVMLFVGRLRNDDKADFDALFEAGARLAAEGLHFRMVLAGTALEEWVTALREKAIAFGLRDRVEILANVTETEKHLLLSACDLFVSPSNAVAESFGLSVVEAMLHARPVVCSAWNGYREIIRDGIDGLLVDTWWNSDASRTNDLAFAVDRFWKLWTNCAIDVGHLTHCLKQLLVDPDLRRKYGYAGQQRASANYTIGRMVADVVTLLKDTRGRSSEGSNASPSSPRLASAFGSYAKRSWFGTESLQADAAASVERALATRTLATMDESDLFERAVADGLVRGSEQGAFSLLRHGLLRVLPHD